MYADISSIFIYFRLFSEEWNTGMSRELISALCKLRKTF